MSRAPVAAVLPPLPQRSPLPPNRVPEASPPAREAEGAAPFDLARLALLPRPQRGAAVAAEESAVEETPAEETAVQPELEVGPAEDEFEREADDVADTVMREPLDTADLEPDDEALRRACAACEGEDKVQRETREEPEERVQRESVAEAEADTGPPSLAASPGALTSGGTPLGDSVRGFYERRLGRDLSHVRLHQGAPARALNDSISARAFTYGSHVWLGEGSASTPSHTLSHELAHVLQQTQPRALRRDADPASAAPAGVQRRNARWVPHKSPTLTKSQGATHDRVVELVSKDPANADLLAEVPIPNAGRRYNPAKSFGFADFVKAAPLGIPGVWVSKAAGAGATPAPAEKDEDEAAAEETDPKKPGAESKIAQGEVTVPSPPDSAIANFDEEDWTPDWLAKLIQAGKMQAGDNARPMQGGKRFDFSTRQHPRISGGKLVGTAQAPRQMAIGELKPGHNVEAGEKAFTQQLPRYRRAMQKVSTAVNAVDPASRDGSWSLTLSDLAGIGGGVTGLHIPDGLHPRSKKPAIERELVLQVGGKKLEPETVVRGHLAFGPHPTHAGVWSYLYIPSKAPSAKKLTAGQRQSIKTLEKKLRELIAALKKTPTKVRRRRAKEQRRAIAARRARRVVRRDAKPRKDDFDRAKWETERKAFATAVRDWKSTDPAAPVIEQQAGSRDAFLEIAGELKNFSVPPMSGQALADIKLLHRLERLADPKFGPLLGVLREKFGSVFVRLANAYDSFRTRLAERMKKAPGEAPSGFSGWKKKAIRLLIAAAVTGAKLLARQVVANFAACIDALGDKLLAKFEGELSETFEAEITAITDAFEEVQTRIEAELEPFLARFDTLFATLSTVAELEPIISNIITTTRIVVQAASCVSPPLKGCLWGLVAQIGIEGVLAIAVDQDWFKEKVINPIARGLINPIADEAYKQILDLLLGAPDAETLRGRLSQMAADTAACRPAKRSQMYSWSGAGGVLPASDPREPSDAARKMMEKYEADHADEIDKAIKDNMRNKDGGPVSDEQVETLLDAVGESGLSPEALKDAFAKARKGGKVDPEAARAQIKAEAGEGAVAEVPGGPGAAGAGGQKKGGGVIDLERADKGFEGEGTPAPWYARLQTPPDQRKANGEVRLTLFFPKESGNTYRFANVAVTFLEVYTEVESEGGAEVPWLRFSISKPIYLKAGREAFNIEAREWHIRLVGEAAPQGGAR